ncbi:MAG: FAD-dependent oxidoreductase [Clostridia bacterium]|nr:FAD-dependent oxidoreductase [Clostridia bacterium]
MKTVRTDRYDFVVCGGGVAGFSAAVAAARKGLSVALVERSGILGGTATCAGINQLLGGRKLDENGNHLRVVGGIFDELTDKLIAEGAAIEPNTVDPDFNPFGWYPRMASGISCNETALKIKMDDMCREAGVRVYFNTVICEADFSHARLSAVTVFNKDGFVRLEAESFADCTGDADVVAMCSLPFSKGRSEDGLMTPCSMEMHVEGVDAEALVGYQNEHQSPKLVEIIERLRRDGIWTFPSEIFVTVRLVEEDVFLVNTLRQTCIDGTCEEDVTRALMNGRRDCLKLFGIMKEYFPGFAHARIRKIADSLGVRETRRIHGVYTVSIEDALSGKRFPDTVAATTYNFDLPDPIRVSYDTMMGDARNPNATRKHVVIRLPYRALLPVGAENLIVAGRCISVDREVLGAARIIGPAMMTGQAAGTAAALAKGNFASVDTDLLRTTLWADGVLDPDTLPFSF